MSEKIYGLMAEFNSPGDVLRAAKAVRAAGYRRWDVFSPFPVHGLDKVQHRAATVQSVGSALKSLEEVKASLRCISKIETDLVSILIFRAREAIYELTIKEDMRLAGKAVCSALNHLLLGKIRRRMKD